MSPEQRDWDKEMAEIDKVIAKSPQAGLPPAPAAQPAIPGQGLPVPGPVRSRKAAAGAWFQVILGGLLAVGMTQWPYANGCGIKLFLYMVAAGLVVVAGVWGAITSWKRHMGLAHTLALVVTLWGLVLVAREVLPRIGYAAQASTWMCP